MNYVLIFKDDESLSGCDQININNLPANPVTIEETEVYLFDDDTKVATVKDKFKGKLNNKENSFYVVLHKTKQEKFKPDFIEGFGPNVICQHHMGGDFHFTIIPKLLEGSLTFEEIKSFFPDLSLETKLKLLHKLLGGDFELVDAEKKLLEQNNFPIEDYEKTFENSPDWKSLITLRDELLKDI